MKKLLPPVETYKPFRDDDSECEVIYNDKKFIVNGSYTEDDLNAFFGTPFTDEIETEVRGDMPTRYHYKTLEYDGIIVRAFQLARISSR